MSAIYYIIVFGLLIVFGATVIAALTWAMRRGQFSNLDRSAATIFDAEEPPGMPTDRFPPPRSPRRRDREAGR